ncbi:MAG: hypothetical protein DRO46_00790 [Candidatus Hecatellales archaeon]|nr:MAG: hypothetical protein DRO46_00790 [Candidatus Hecatellales archaeon]
MLGKEWGNHLNKRILIAVVLIVVVVAAVFGGLQFFKPSGPERLRIGYMAAATYALVWVAYEKGYFEEEGLDVALYQYDNVGDLATALSKGEIDGCPLTAVAAAAFAEKAKLLVVAGNSTHGTGLACRPEDAAKLKTLKDLDGKKLATVLYVPGDIVLRYKLKQEEVNVDLLVLFTAADALTSLKKGNVDAALLWEPFVSLAEEEGLTVFLWDKDIYDITYPCCLQVFREKYARSHPDAVVKYLRALLKAQKFCEEHPKEAAALAAKYLPMVPEEIVYKSVFYVDPRLGRTRNPLDVNLYMDDLVKFVEMMRELSVLSPRASQRFLQRVDVSFLSKAMSS